MNEDLISGVLKTAPQVGAILAIVIIFLRYVTSRDKAFNEAIEKRDKITEQLQANCHAVQRETVSAMRENTLMLGKVSEALDLRNGGR